MNLSKHVDPVINKRLSSSSATLLNSPDRGTVSKEKKKKKQERMFYIDVLLCTYSKLLKSFSVLHLSGSEKTSNVKSK